VEKLTSLRLSQDILGRKEAIQEKLKKHKSLAMHGTLEKYYEQKYDVEELNRILLNKASKTIGPKKARKFYQIRRKEIAKFHEMSRKENFLYNLNLSLREYRSRNRVFTMGMLYRIAILKYWEVN